ncbi:copper chaperone PCu(A)C [Rhodobaculum claviforme]|uniref:Copper chaperone PCu(A)C n=1 Tax=Rhodobaculum claviforme TaxID=1549854 RepID=A0A934WI10_9RHOB|nr:copper chaperone PCu(A)C [Rhodobaculum claviforme]MBK5926414.1 hypothetical protein [Rhodobaculum claviforme]
MPTRPLAVALLMLLPLPALAEGPLVHEPFAIISPAGQSGAAFMRLENPGPEDDRLVSASAGIAARVELHTHIEDSAGVMRMVEVEDGFALPAGSEHVLERGGDHVMFMGIDAAPEPGAVIALTLTFESGATVVVDVPVKAPMSGHGH